MNQPRVRWNFVMTTNSCKTPYIKRKPMPMMAQNRYWEVPDQEPISIPRTRKLTWRLSLSLSALTVLTSPERILVNGLVRTRLQREI
jgi:hypothetical protein